MNTAVTLLALCLVAVPAQAVEAFKIKGLSLGAAPESACADAAISTKMDQLLQTMMADAPDLQMTGVSQCHIESRKFADFDIDQGIDLLFLDGRLIQIKFDLKTLKLLTFATIFDSLEEMYGTPEISKSEIFTTHTWKQGTNVFALSRVDGEDLTTSVEVYLRDTVGFERYESRVAANGLIIDQMVRERKKENIRY